MRYARARDEEGKPVRCPRCNGWLFELYAKSYGGPGLFCGGCDWLAHIEEQEDVETATVVEGAEPGDEGR